jgi:hypothetical protein
MVIKRIFFTNLYIIESSANKGEIGTETIGLLSLLPNSVSRKLTLSLA